MWLFAILLTIFSIVFQRITGPSYPVEGQARMPNVICDYSLARSHVSTQLYTIKLLIPDMQVYGQVEWRNYKIQGEPWKTIAMNRQGSLLVASLPQRRPADKIEYKVILERDKARMVLNDGEPIVIRFRGYVPEYWLIPHIILMFAAMLLANRTGIGAMLGNSLDQIYKWSWSTMICLFMGGVLFGGIVQYYAFEAFWTGIPFGTDLTDNKTLVALIIWAITLRKLYKDSKKARNWTIAAFFVTLIVYCIPHSLLGT